MRRARRFRQLQGPGGLSRSKAPAETAPHHGCLGQGEEGSRTGRSLFLAVGGSVSDVPDEERSVGGAGGGEASVRGDCHSSDGGEVAFQCVE